MDHFTGTNARERYDNDLLNEMRQIRILLERNAQAVEPVKTVRQIKPATRQTRKKVAGK